jgi:TM2 domain-containing membrane protein YozV
MTYLIIGADGRQYGPATTEQLREWITAGRANNQTLAQAEGTPGWKPLSAFPEFALPPIDTSLPPLMGAQDLRKSKLVAGLLGILLGGLGVHRFYLGFIGIGVAQIVVTFVTCGVGSIWGLIEGILILVGNSITHDAEGRPLKE